MARINPFRAYRYAAKAGDLQSLITQPYDKISVDMQQRYLESSPYNLVRIILGERLLGDTDQENVYTRAAQYFRDWILDGILKQDDEPAFYPYFQEFTMPDTGERLVRQGFIGLGAVEDYSTGIVHPHEQTLSGPKKDRMQVLQHTGAHFGQIFMLYPDKEGSVDQILEQTAKSQLISQVSDEYGAIHRLWKIVEPELIQEIQTMMADKKLLIADGHHRYETALAFHAQNPSQSAASRVMMTFVNMYSPGLRILPTHRVLSGVTAFDPVQVLNGLRSAFQVLNVGALKDIQKAWSEPHHDYIRIGAVLEGARYAVLQIRRDRRLDVNVLHEQILRDILKINDEAVRNEEFIRYIRGAEAAAHYVTSGEAQAVFLLEPPTIDQVAEISFSGGVMPQKSTDFYPKLLSGVAIYKLD